MTSWAKQLLVVICMLGCVAFCGAEEYPASVSFLVVDYKYNEQNGVKICEIQTLGPSGLSRNENEEILFREGEIALEKATKTVHPYCQNRWFTKQGVVDTSLQRRLRKDGWKMTSSVKQIARDHRFQEVAQEEVQDTTDLASYQGLVWVHLNQMQSVEEFKAMYPGILVVDEYMLPCWEDKYDQSVFFARDLKLEQYKPKWKLYSKVYTEDLADTILKDMGSDIVVIKPRGLFRGIGVCIVEKDNLDQTLKAIITKEGLPAKGKVAYWREDNGSDFIVEQFIESDTIEVEGKGYRQFDPTYRMVFGVTSQKQEIDVVIIAAYGKLPARSLDQEASLDEKHKSDASKDSYVTLIPAKVRKEMESQLTDCVTRYYKQLLKQASKRG